MRDVVPNRKSRAPTRPPFECIALLLQGGGALGSYQAGVYASAGGGRLCSRTGLPASRSARSTAR